MSFATRLATNRLDDRSDGEVLAERADALPYATPRRGEAKDAKSDGERRRRGSGRRTTRSCSPPRSTRAEAKGEGPRRQETKADVVGEALGYWKDFWRHYEDPDLEALFDFEMTHYEAWDPDVDEHTHDQAALHRDYRDLFERVLANHLEARLGLGPADFFAALEGDLEGADASRSANARAFLDVVRKADDYATFSESMRAAVAHARWLEEPD